MNPNSNYIEISSDSSSDSDSLASPLSFRLPTIPRGLTKEPTRKRRHDPHHHQSFFLSQCNPNAPPSDKGPSQPPSVFGPVTAFLQSDMERVVAGMSKIPVSEKPEASRKRKGPLKVVIGLACPRLWNKDMQSIGVHKCIPDPKDKGKGKMKD